MKIQASDLGDYIQGGIPDDEFGDENGIVTEKGARAPQEGHAADRRRRARGTLEAEKVITLFTVENLADMVAARCRRRLRLTPSGSGSASTSSASTAVARLVDRRSKARSTSSSPSGEQAYCATQAPALPAPGRALRRQGGGAEGVRHRPAAAHALDRRRDRQRHAAAGPRSCLHGEVAAQARRHGLEDLDVSISHAEDLAMAQALAIWAPAR